MGVLNFYKVGVYVLFGRDFFDLVFDVFEVYLFWIYF